MELDWEYSTILQLVELKRKRRSIMREQIGMKELAAFELLSRWKQVPRPTSRAPR